VSTLLAQPLQGEQSDDDPFFDGWRYVLKKGADGKEKRIQVPLTQKDVLHPQEDDFIMHNEAHEEDCHYLKTVLAAHLAGQPGTVIYRDQRIDWGVAEIEPHGPDLAVLADVPNDRNSQQGTLHLSMSGAHPLLVIEVTSPSTRDVNLDEKVVEYDRVGVPFYAIVDRRIRNDREELRLLAYRTTREGYVRVKLDGQGWLALEPIGLSLGIEGRNLVCRDARGERLLDYQEVVQAFREATARAQAAEARAEAEAQARQAIEERLRQLEAEMNRLCGQS
jgi:colicin import membrane protein